MSVESAKTAADLVKKRITPKTSADYLRELGKSLGFDEDTPTIQAVGTAARHDDRGGGRPRN